MYGYLITAIAAIVSVCLPLFSLSASKSFTPLLEAGLDPIDYSVTTRGIESPYGWVVIGCAVVGGFFVLAKYKRVPVFVLGIITTACLILNAVTVMVSEDAVYGRFSFIPGMANISEMVDISLGAGYYLGAIAAFLMLFFTIATFISVRENY